MRLCAGCVAIMTTGPFLQLAGRLTGIRPAPQDHPIDRCKLGIKLLQIDRIDDGYVRSNRFGLLFSCLAINKIGMFGNGSEN